MERIVAERGTGRRKQFKVRWTGYGPEEDKWLRESELENAPAVLEAWQQEQSARVGLIDIR